MHLAICDDHIADRKQMERLLGRESDRRLNTTGVLYVDSFGNRDAILTTPMIYDGLFIDMTEETQPESLSFACPLDDAGYVGHDKRLSLTVGNDTKVRFKRGERIVGNLRTSGRNGRKQSRLSGIRESHQTDISQKLQFEYDRHLLHRLSRLGKARSLPCGGTEMPVSQSAASALQQDNFLSVLSNVAYILSSLGIISHRSARHLDNLVFTVFSETFVLRAVSAMRGEHVTLVLQMQQRPVVPVSPQDYMTSSATVATVRPSVGHVFFTAHVRRATASLAGAAVDLYIVNKIRFSHST